LRNQAFLCIVRSIRNKELIDMEKQDSVYEKYVSQKIEEGLGDIEKGAVYTREEAREYLYNKTELREALESLSSTLRKCEKSFEKLKQGTSQHTLLERRIKAFKISISLIERELRN